MWGVEPVDAKSRPIFVIVHLCDHDDPSIGCAPSSIDVSKGAAIELRISLGSWGGSRRLEDVPNGAGGCQAVSCDASNFNAFCYS